MTVKKLVGVIIAGAFLGFAFYTVNLSQNANAIKTTIIFLIAYFFYALNFFVSTIIEKKIEAVKEQEIIKKPLKYFFIALAIISLTGFWFELLREAIIAILALIFLFVFVGKRFFENCFGGVFIAINQLFSVGDKIESQKFKGRVINYNLETTKIRETKNGFTGKTIIVPNSFFMKNAFKNVTGDLEYVWSDTSFKVSPKNFEKKIKKIKQEIITKTLIPISIEAKEKLSTVSSELLYYKQGVEPSIFTEFDGKNIIMHIRFIVEEKKRQAIENKIQQKAIKILKE